MTSHSDTSKARAGFSLFEALVSLALLSIILAVTVRAVRPPSPSLTSKAQLADLIRAAGDARGKAIAQSQTVDWIPADILNDAKSCDEGETVAFQFFADGTAKGSDICTSSGRLMLDPFTGLLSESVE